ncbi:MAG: M23 family metallopeptidase [Trueperaceae bacterium]|nr:M23 family metallopeptidase [Trueperaceae bacterium]
MTRARRLHAALVGGGVVLLLLVGLGLGQALRDTTPPSLWVEAPERVAAGTTFTLDVSADEPARYVVQYAGTRTEAVEQAVSVPLEAAPGRHRIRIVAQDAAGNETTAGHDVFGVVVPEGRLEMPEGLRPGDPFTVRLRFSPPYGERTDVRLSVDGTSLDLHPMEGGAWALGAVPLATDAGSLSVRASWRDGLGRATSAAQDVPYDPLGRTVETLTIAEEVLAVITPEGRGREAAALASARADPGEPPRWRAPFVLPIEGRGTSGFARPRRYVPGGPVSFHLGEDIAAPTGTPIMSPNDGVVTLADMFPIKGGLTVIDHGAGVTSRFYHQSRIGVEEGSFVQRGQVIGEVGSTGLSTGPHLHWEMRVDGVPSDPLAWVGTARP